MDSLKKSRLIAMVTVPQPEMVIPLAQSLMDGGIDWIEITFRNENAVPAIEALHQAKSPIIYGAGTVRTPYQAQKAQEAGSQYLVAPGFNETVVKWALTHKITIIPGVDSTLGIELAQEYGMSVVKMFPAVQIGGIEWLKAMQGPYYDMQFIPSAGITLDNMKAYLALKNVIAVTGSFLAPPNLIKEQKWAEITAIAKKASEIAKSAK
jgi:2-dehydro-3-deoxyphosphogluconate aldolase/(4S)-4-hydroxy-2-oxoglutarate aldolase